MIYLTIAFFLGIFVAAVAGSKGRNPVLWGLYGALLSVIAIPHALLIETKRKCRHCSATVWGNELVCEHCRHRISPGSVSSLKS